MRFTNKTTGATPTRFRSIAKLGKIGAMPAANDRIGFGAEHRRVEVPQEDGIFRIPGDIEDPLVLTPGEDRFTGEPAVGMKDNARFGEAFTDHREDLFKRLDGAVGSISITGAKLRPDRPWANEAIEGKIAVGSVVAVEELPLPVPVNEAVGRVKVEDDFIGVSLQFGDRVPDEESFNRVKVGPDFVGT